MDDKWIDSIKEKMADYEVVPAAGLLDAVEAQVRAVRMRRRRILGVIAASIALIGVMTVALIPDMPDVAPKALVSDSVVEDEAVENSKEEFISRTAEPSAGDKPITISKSSQRAVAAKSIEVPAIESATLTVEEDGRDEQEVYDGLIKSETETHAPIEMLDHYLYSEYLSAVGPVASSSDTHAPVSVGVATSANGLGGIFDGDGMEGPELLASASVPRTRMGGGMLGSSNIAEPPAPRFIEMFDHKLPIRASVDFSWPLGYNLSIGTGVTYSYLRSDIRYGYSDSPLFKASQSLHFLGIPVHLRYTPFSIGKLDIYVSGGFMAEKCISGSIKSENPQDPGYNYVGCDDRPFQFSVNAAAGLQYSLAGSCAVFIEPGIGLYLKNGSRLRTIYSERPMTFNINVGLRFGN